MRMTLVFAAFATIAWLASNFLWHLAPGLGTNMMLVYLGLAMLSALIALISGGGRRGS